MYSSNDYISFLPFDVCIIEGILFRYVLQNLRLFAIDVDHWPGVPVADIIMD